MEILETKTKETRDSWGHKGVCTYERHTEWFNGEGRWTEYWAYVVVNDTSTGHGWGGQMCKQDWDKITGEEL